MKENDSIESLVRSARNGDRAAFKIIYDRYHQRVYRTAYRLLGERMRAEDVTQEVFVRMYQKLDHFDFKSAFQTWCYRITINACYDIMRKQQRRGNYNKGPVNPDFYKSEMESPKHTRPEERLHRKEKNVMKPFSDVALISNARIIAQAKTQSSQNGWLHPGLVFWGLFVLVGGITVSDLMKRTKTIWIDQWLFGLVGILGIVLLVASVGSQHEPLHQNWNLVWALPTHLVVAAGITRWQNVSWFEYYLWAALVLDAGLLLNWYLIPQHLPTVVIPLILSLVIRSAFNLLT